MRCLYTQMQKNTKLMECDVNSLRSAAISCASMGVEPNGRDAHLIPFNNKRKGIVECQLIIDFKGLARLALQSGEISYLHASVICENDVFEYDKGQIKTHKINFKGGRGKMYAAYALARFKDGTEKGEVMPKEEIDSIRARSRSSGSGPWVTDYNEMAKKTVFRRLTKWLPLSPEIFEKIAATDEINDLVTVREASPVAVFSAAPAIEEASATVSEEATASEVADLKKPAEASPEAKPEPKTDAPSTEPEPEKTDEPKTEGEPDWEKITTTLPETQNMPQLKKLLDDNGLYPEQIMTWAKKNSHDLTDNDFVLKAINGFGNIQDAIGKF